ncbi:MAG: hypothetical protein ACOX7I_05850 [Oscillospiraceae bacterium]
METVFGDSAGDKLIEAVFAGSAGAESAGTESTAGGTSADATIGGFFSSETEFFRLKKLIIFLLFAKNLNISSQHIIN